VPGTAEFVADGSKATTSLTSALKNKISGPALLDLRIDPFRAGQNTATRGWPRGAANRGGTRRQAHTSAVETAGHRRAEEARTRNRLTGRRCPCFPPPTLRDCTHVIVGRGRSPPAVIHLSGQPVIPERGKLTQHGDTPTPSEQTPYAAALKADCGTVNADGVV
jgi:hypothetical protein